MIRVLNVLAIVKGTPQIIEAFPIYEEQISEQVIEQAEKYLCNTLVGPQANTDDYVDVIMKAYTVGVKSYGGSVYYLLWSEIES